MVMYINAVLATMRKTACTRRIYCFFTLVALETVNYAAFTVW